MYRFMRGSCASTAFRFPAASASAAAFAFSGGASSRWCFPRMWPIIKNINADAVIAVYPFTPQPAITQAILSVSEVPGVCRGGGWPHQWAEVGQHRRLCRASGGLWAGVQRLHHRGGHSGHQGDGGDPAGVHGGVGAGRTWPGSWAAGVDFLNVSGAARTPEIVAHIREIFPEVPIIATGGRRMTPSGPPSRPGPMPSPTRRPPALSCLPRVCGNTGASLRKGLRRSRKMKGSAPTRQAGGC